MVVQRLVRRSAAPQELAHPASAPLHRQLRSPEQLPFPSAHQSGAVPRSDARAPRHLSAFRDMTRKAERRSEEHTSELQSLMRISYAVFCLKKKKKTQINAIAYINTTQQQNNKHNHHAIN